MQGEGLLNISIPEVNYHQDKHEYNNNIGISLSPQFNIGLWTTLVICLRGKEVKGGLISFGIVALIWVDFGGTLTVYDTSGQFHHRAIKTKAISLTGVRKCSHQLHSSYTPQKQTIQIVQKMDLIQVNTSNCRIIVQTKILHCDNTLLGNFVYPSQDEDLNRALKLNAKECRNFVSTGEVTVNIYGIEVTLRDSASSAQTVQYTLHGSQYQDGSCSGVKLSINGRLLESAVVIATITHSIFQYPGVYNVETRRITIKNLIKLNTDKGSTQHDIQFGTFIFSKEEIPQNECERSKVIYEGTATLHIPQEENLGSQQFKLLTRTLRLLLCVKRKFAF